MFELGNRGKTIFEQRLKDVKEKVTNDFRWIREKAFQGMGGRDYGGQTVVARGIEEVAKGILRKLGLPTETEANLDLDVGELPGDPVDLFWAIWDEATGMMIRGLAASPCCARRILHLARAVEQWHEEGDVPGLKSLLTPDTNINCRDFSGKNAAPFLGQFSAMLGSHWISAPSWS